MNKKILSDVFWYALGTSVPIIVNVVKSPIFTRYYSPTEYGSYTISLITFNYISIALFYWITSCMWRYYNQYKGQNDIRSLYSNLGFLFLVSSVIQIAITFIWYLKTEDPDSARLFLFSGIHYIVNEILVLILIPYRLERKSFFYNSFYSLNILAGFILSLFFTFILKMNIESLIISLIIMNSCTILFIFLMNIRKLPFSLSLVSLSNTKKFFNYGSIGMLLNFGTLILALSDRYVIKYFCGLESVGIYNQIYQIGVISLNVVVNVYYGAVTPILNKEMEFNLENSDKVIFRYVKIFILTLLPMAFYLSIYAKEVVFLLLGPKFRIGYPMVPYVIFGTFFSGLTLFYSNKLKFIGNFKVLLLGIFSVSIINIILNLILIPRYGYFCAAYTTLFCYLVLFLIYLNYCTKEYTYKQKLSGVFVFPLTVLLIQLIIHFMLRYYKITNQLFLLAILEATAFSISYYLLAIKRLNNLLKSN